MSPMDVSLCPPLISVFLSLQGGDMDPSISRLTCWVTSMKKDHPSPKRPSKSPGAASLDYPPRSYVFHFPSFGSLLRCQFLVKTSLTTLSNIAPYLSHSFQLDFTLFCSPVLPGSILLINLCTSLFVYYLFSQEYKLHEHRDYFGPIHL